MPGCRSRTTCGWARTSTRAGTPTWRAGRVGRLGLDPKQKAGTLSGGQRAQLALTLAVAKRPELLILDEPVASLDPLARREFLQDLMESVAEQEVSVVLSSHLISDLERACDYVIVLVGSRVRLAGPVDDLLAAHHLLSGPRRDPASLPDGLQVISASHTDVQTTLLVRASGPVLDPAWAVSEVGLEDLVLAYMRQAARPAPRNDLTVTWRCGNDLADLAAVPCPGHHRGRGAGRVRDPAGSHRIGPVRHVRQQRAPHLPRRCLLGAGQHVP